MTTSTPPRKTAESKPVPPDSLTVPGAYDPVRLILERGFELVQAELAEQNRQTDPLYQHALRATRRHLKQSKAFALDFPADESGDAEGDE
jgi:hypothetical protein